MIPVVGTFHTIPFQCNKRKQDDFRPSDVAAAKETQRMLCSPRVGQVRTELNTPD
jgi:hypothetical protein